MDSLLMGKAISKKVQKSKRRAVERVDGDLLADQSKLSSQQTPPVSGLQLGGLLALLAAMSVASVIALILGVMCFVRRRDSTGVVHLLLGWFVSLPYLVARILGQVAPKFMKNLGLGAVNC